MRMGSEGSVAHVIYSTLQGMHTVFSVLLLLSGGVASGVVGGEPLSSLRALLATTTAS